jgi:hypothetical protein
MNPCPFRPLLLAALCAVPFTFLRAVSPSNSGDSPALLADDENAPAITKKFLHSTEGTYGWMPVQVKRGISYDFFPDGRLHIQGPDGEATMWEGKWSLKGDQLTIINSDKKETKTYTAKIDGKFLLLDGRRYTRQKAE